MNKRLLLALGLLMFLVGIAYGQHRQCDVYWASCSFAISNCQVVGGRCPAGQCGNPDQAGCCVWENGICNSNGLITSTQVCASSCNP